MSEKQIKIIGVGDIHGRKDWKDIVLREEDADFYVFVGDYFDSFDVPGMTQLENFKDIMEFKRNNKERVILLLGNHDMSYYDGFDETCSGYQHQYQYLIRGAIADANQENMLQMAWQWKNILFTHAGVSKTFLGTLSADAETVADRLNTMLYFRPRTFRFNGYNNGGDDITQSNIWIRPNSLCSDLIPDHIQVVGHTRMPGGVINVLDKVYFIDVLEDTKKQYLRIIEGKFEICNVNTTEVLG